MKKIFVPIFLIAFTVIHAQDSSKSVNGGIARTTALGGGPTNPYILDYSDVFINPAYALKYSHLLFSDIGYLTTANSAAGQSLGIALGFDTIAIGIAVGRREGPMFAENATSPGDATFQFTDHMTGNANAFAGVFAPIPVVVGEPNTSVQIFGSYKLKPLILGIAIYRSGWSSVDDGTGLVAPREYLETSQEQSGAKAGILMDLNQSVALDISILFRNNSSTIEHRDADTTSPDRKYEANGNEYGINARTFIKLNDKMEIVTQGRFGYFSYEPLITTIPAPAAPVNDKPNNYSKIEYEMGAAINTKFSGGFASIGLSIQSIGLTNDITAPSGGAGSPLQTTKNSVTFLDLPKINVGSEFELLSWLTGRIGYFKRLTTKKITTELPTLGSQNTKEVDGIESGFVPRLGYTTLDQQLSLGMGLKFGRLAIDGYVGERFLAAGPYVLSGNVQDMFGVLSMSVKL